MDARHLWQLSADSRTSPTGADGDELPSLLDAGPIGFRVWWTTHGGARPLDRAVTRQPTAAGSPS